MNKILLGLFLLVGALSLSCGLLGSKDDNEVPVCIFSEEEHSIISNSGKIVLSMIDETDAQNYQIFVMNSDGSDLQQLTFFEYDDAISPSWSPDGSQIVFTTSYGSTSLGFSLYVMNADGSNMHPLKRIPDSNFVVPGAGPKWSPNGDKIAFFWCQNCELGGSNYEVFVYNFKSDSVTRVTNNLASDTFPSWRSDGQQLAFISNREYHNADTLSYKTELYTIDIDGKNLTQITNLEFVDNPLWMHNNKSIFIRKSNPFNRINKVDIKTRQTCQVETSFSENFILYPISWNSTYSKLLIYSYGVNSPHDNSLWILSLNEKNRRVKILSKSIKSANPAISGADWYYP